MRTILKRDIYPGRGARTDQMTRLAVRRQLEHLSQRVQHLPRRPCAYSDRASRASGRARLGQR